MDLNHQPLKSPLRDFERSTVLSLRILSSLKNGHQNESYLSPFLFSSTNPPLLNYQSYHKMNFFNDLTFFHGQKHISNTNINWLNKSIIKSWPHQARFLPDTFTLMWIIYHRKPYLTVVTLIWIIKEHVQGKIHSTNKKRYIQYKVWYYFYIKNTIF